MTTPSQIYAQAPFRPEYQTPLTPLPQPLQQPLHAKWKDPSRMAQWTTYDSKKDLAKTISKAQQPAQEPGWFTKHRKSLGRRYKRAFYEGEQLEHNVFDSRDHLLKLRKQGKLKGIIDLPPPKPETPLDEYVSSDHKLFQNPLYQSMWGLKDSLVANCGYLETAGIAFLMICMLSGFIIYMKFPEVMGEDRSKINETDPDSSEKEIDERQKSRGQIASIFVSTTFGVFNGLVDYTGKVNPATSTALFGMLLGGTLGFLADIAYGTDEGKRTFDDDPDKLNGLDYTFASLATGKYMRFIIVTLIDTFISLMIFSVAYPMMKRMPVFRCLPALANAGISATIAIVTFNAYANQTRFQYAYPDANAAKNSLIPTPTILLIAALASMVFLKTNTMFDLEEGYGPKDQGINHPTVKLFLVVALLGLLTLSVFFDVINPETRYDLLRVEGENNRIEYVQVPDCKFISKKELVSGFKPLVGRIIFSTILCIAVFGTLLTQNVSQSPLGAFSKAMQKGLSGQEWLKTAIASTCIVGGVAGSGFMFSNWQTAAIGSATAACLIAVALTAGRTNFGMKGLFWFFWTCVFFGGILSFVWINGPIGSALGIVESSAWESFPPDPPKIECCQIPEQERRACFLGLKDIEQEATEPSPITSF